MNYLEPIDGPDRDLNFAIETGGKKVIGLVNKLTLDYDRLSPADAKAFALQLFALTASTDIGAKKSSHLFASIGKYLLRLSESDDGAEFVFKEWSRRLLSVDCSDSEQCQAAFQWLMLFNQVDGSAPSPKPLKGVFDRSQSELNAIQEKLAVPFEKREVLKDKSGVQPGFKLLELFAGAYFYHSDVCPEHLESWVVDCVKKEVGFGNNIILSVLRRSENYADVAARLLDLYIRSMIDENQPGMGWWLFLNLFDTEKYSAGQLDLIVDNLEPFIRDWDLKQRSHAIKCLFSVSNENDKVKTEKLLVKSQGARRLAEKLSADGDSDVINELSELLHGNLSPVYKFPEGGENQFKDVNFKLIVINELMYVKKSLVPEFNIHDFSKEYDHGEVVATGYEIIPEALEYMRRLKIPDELLSTITELNYDPSSDIYGQIVPCWDGEDGTFEVSSLGDLDKLRNVKKIEGFSQTLVDSFPAIINSKGITAH